MKEIDRFLCKAICNGVWKTGFLVEFDGSPLNGVNLSYTYHLVTPTGIYPVSIINSICGNSGFTDKNKKYMYEGDIVIMDKGKASLTAEIIYYNGAYRIKDEFTSNIANCAPLSDVYYEREFEVIKNIHDDEYKKLH